MKLVIVEDEFRLRSRIAEGIPWEEHGIDLVGAAENGKEGLALVEKIGADIVLADIRMPVMDGLEMAGILHARYPHVKTVILSGHDEFEYARQSLQLGVLDYLLKPASNEAIAEAVLKAAHKRRQDLEDMYNHEQLQHKWKAHLPHLRQTFFTNWLSGRYAGWEVVKRADELALELPDRPLAAAVLDMDPLPEGGTRFLSGDRSLLLFSLFSIAEERLKGSTSYLVQDDDGMTAVVFYGLTEETKQEFYQRINNLVVDVLSVVKECLKVTASAGIGSVAPTHALLAESYQKARQALRERIVHGNDIAISFREQPDAIDKWTSMTELEKPLETAMDLGDEAQAKQVADSMVRTAFTAASMHEVREFLIHISGILSRFIHARQWLLTDIAKEDYPFFENLGQLVTKEQIREWVVRMIGRICRYVNDNRKSSTRQTVVEILKIIDERLQEEISLYKISEDLYLNASYLSRLFKEEMDISFSDYLLQRRMERAKLLLVQGCKVYEAAEQSGFKQVNYFSKTFQKYWGVKPGELNK
ncbi:response regulator [Paenibacillus sp. MBLB4367]|uniref:response regulator n=1 Tax=Paenibacillus sp. MBLB4367 TaxID=3384767 RepID=UPI00390827AA